jgi:hypothetical protein
MVNAQRSTKGSSNDHSTTKQEKKDTKKQKKHHKKHKKHHKKKSKGTAFLGHDVMDNRQLAISKIDITTGK